MCSRPMEAFVTKASCHCTGSTKVCPAFANCLNGFFGHTMCQVCALNVFQCCATFTEPEVVASCPFAILAGGCQRHDGRSVGALCRTKLVVTKARLAGCPAVGPTDPLSQCARGTDCQGLQGSEACSHCNPVPSSEVVSRGNCSCCELSDLVAMLAALRASCQQLAQVELPVTVTGKMESVQCAGCDGATAGTLSAAQGPPGGRLRPSCTECSLSLRRQTQPVWNTLPAP